jgi:tetraprenyl-beta-curcumene synthase
MAVPRLPWTMTAKILLGVIPRARRHLDYWKGRASAIPDPELRKQALASIETKTFHCEGGSLYALLAGAHREDAIRFIVAYQTISDYLDNLCDRSTSLDPEDFSALHQSMLHALTPGAQIKNYYRLRSEQDDGGYLEDLVRTCQDVLSTVPRYDVIASYLHELEGYYAELQVHKHVRLEERVPRLQGWFDRYRSGLPEMRWYEFSACAGSTLGIFCLVSLAFDPSLSAEDSRMVRQAYFPWVQGLHILLDYFVDQEEDRIGGDLNFCSFYENSEVTVERLVRVFKEADRSVTALPHKAFHRMVCHGLLAMYLADRKVDQQEKMRQMAIRIMKEGRGATALFFMTCWVRRRLRNV